MTKQRSRTQRGLHYQALAEGYKILRPGVAESFRLAAEHYDQADPPLDPRAKREDERAGETVE
jgi:hypothetical protein